MAKWQKVTANNEREHLISSPFHLFKSKDWSYRSSKYLPHFFRLFSWFVFAVKIIVLNTLELRVNANCHLKTGIDAYKEGALNRAKRELEKALNLISEQNSDINDWVLVRNNLAVVCTSLGEFEKASKLLSEVLSHKSLDELELISVRSNLADVRIKQGLIETAILLLDENMHSTKELLGPDSIELAVSQIELARGRSTLGMDYETLKLFNKSIQLLENHKESSAKQEALTLAYFSLAEGYFNSSLYKKAASWFLKVIELLNKESKPTSLVVATTWCNLAKCYAGMSKSEKAIEAIEIAIREFQNQGKTDRQEYSATLRWAAVFFERLGNDDRVQDIIELLEQASG